MYINALYIFKKICHFDQIQYIDEILLLLSSLHIQSGRYLR